VREGGALQWKFDTRAVAMRLTKWGLSNCTSAGSAGEPCAPPQCLTMLEAPECAEPVPVPLVLLTPGPARPPLPPSPTTTKAKLPTPTLQLTPTQTLPQQPVVVSMVCVAVHSV
jgi:hypothetical protein